jgi:NAD(P)-dependent dehydrogenase (short-subunit alcohol dehydrogenase family)
MDLKGAVAIVTGGGTGIGRAVVLDLARAGVQGLVVNYSRSAADAERTATEAAGLGAEAVAVRADVVSDADCRSLAAAAVERFGRLDVLVNNAGTTHFIPHGDLDSVTEEVWDDILRVNIRGTFQCSRAAASELRRAPGGGAIVNVSSIAGWRTSGSSIPYGVSKAGLTHMTRFFAATLAPEVRVNSVSPGLVATRWFRQRFGEDAAGAQEEVFASTAPLREVPGPEHVAQVVMGLLGMDMVTGVDVVVDAGMHLLYGPASAARRA